MHVALAAAVAPGGTLRIVGHAPSEHDSSGHSAHGNTGPHATPPEVNFTAGEAAADLDPDRWDILIAEMRPRPATGHDGREITLHDAVLRARKRA